MLEAAFIAQCADPRLSIELVEKFVEAINVDNPLQVTITSANKLVAVPMSKTATDALDLTKAYLGRAGVRIGATQYPIGMIEREPDKLNIELFEPCTNMRLGTALFGKIHRIVTRWYGNPRPEAFDDALAAYDSGYFEGENIIDAKDPGPMAASKQSYTDVMPKHADQQNSADSVPNAGAHAAKQGSAHLSEANMQKPAPGSAPMRIDLNRISDHNRE